jgi:SAM-dependent methyltransferase
MTNPLLLSLFNLRRYRSSFRRVFVLVDPQTGVDTAEIFRVTRPWQSWMTITGVVTVDRASVAAALLTTDARQADILLCLSNDGPIKTIVRAACLDGGRTFIDPTLAPQHTREHALYQEVLHHDFELGGFNEWTGKDAQYSSAVLRMMSATHCRMAFPAYAAKPLGELWQQNGGRPLQALDVSCGAISRLRARSGLLTITGVDPLLDMRDRARAARLQRCRRSGARGRSPSARRICHRPSPGSFDFVYCANALDHTEDPGRVIESIASALRIGGVFAVDVYTREGSRENWWQLHQFDMYLNDHGEFLAETRDGVVRPLLPAGCGLVVREIAARHETTALVLERVDGQGLRKTA